MIDRNKEVAVRNRYSSIVGYTLNELGGLRRSFQPGETKLITFDELEKLSWVPGGMEILRDELIIEDEEALKAILNHVEPEYYYSDAEVRQLLTTGTLDQLLDCLDFAPSGVLELVKQLAVSLPCNDVAKRKAILDKLGYDVTQAIELAKVDKAEETEINDGVKKRRAVEVKAATPTRRSNYIVKTQEKESEE